MVLGKTYAEVKKDFINDFKTEGQKIDEWTEYLSDRGFYVVRKGIQWRFDNKQAREWILAPFAPVHILRTRWKFDTTDHVIVMDAAGKMFDPSGISHERLKESYLFTDSVGLFPLGHPGPKK